MTEDAAWIRKVYRQLYFDEETQREYLVHGTLEDGFAVYLNGKQVDWKLEWRILNKTVFVSKMWRLELARQERAARRLRARLIHIPYYAERDRKSGMRFWRALQSHTALNYGP